MTARLLDGACLSNGGRDFTFHVDPPDEDGHGACWYQCDTCEAVIFGGDDALQDHECPVELQDCHRCGDQVPTVSADNYCPGCVAELAPTDCPACEGRQEIQTGIDFFGEAITVACAFCRGTGDVTADALAWWKEQQP